MLQSDFFDKETEALIDLNVIYGAGKHITDKCMIIFSKEMRIPLERNSLHASAGRLSAPNGKFLSYTGLRMFLPFSSRRNAL